MSQDNQEPIDEQLPKNWRHELFPEEAKKRFILRWNETHEMVTLFGPMMYGERKASE